LLDGSGLAKSESGPEWVVRRLVLAGHVADSADTQAILCFWFPDGHSTQWPSSPVCVR
jgi:hypothetical protein